jgi:ubiquinol-cytochrome c reductase cytochrome b subunit
MCSSYIITWIWFKYPLGISAVTDNIPFMPYYGNKDLLSFIFVWLIYTYYVFYTPYALGHADNFIEANSLVTPAHIVPEWYFLPLYAVLRSVPNKLFGVFLILMFIVCIIFLPFYNKSIIRSGMFRPFYSFFVWIFFFVCLLLGWIGSMPVICPYYEIGQVLTFLYFFILLIIFPSLNFFERVIYLSYILVKKKVKKYSYVIFYFFIIYFIFYSNTRNNFF